MVILNYDVKTAYIMILTKYILQYYSINDIEASEVTVLLKKELMKDFKFNPDESLQAISNCIFNFEYPNHNNFNMERSTEFYKEIEELNKLSEYIKNGEANIYYKKYTEDSFKKVEKFFNEIDKLKKE